MYGWIIAADDDVVEDNLLFSLDVITFLYLKENPIEYKWYINYI